MKTTRVLINHEYFELITDNPTKAIINDLRKLDLSCTSCTLYDCYTKPSEDKLRIFNEWLSWAIEIPQAIKVKISVVSFNKFCFKLGIRVLLNDNSTYLFIITKDHKYMILA